VMSRWKYISISLGVGEAYLLLLFLSFSYLVFLMRLFLIHIYGKGSKVNILNPSSLFT
jgi:hypothetical protein